MSSGGRPFFRIRATDCWLGDVAALARCWPGWLPSSQSGVGTSQIAPETAGKLAVAVAGKIDVAANVRTALLMGGTTVSACGGSAGLAAISRVMKPHQDGR